MNDTKENEVYEVCLACIGSGAIYESEDDIEIPCKYCDATGEASTADNEIFLSKEINQD